MTLMPTLRSLWRWFWKEKPESIPNWAQRRADMEARDRHKHYY